MYGLLLINMWVNFFICFIKKLTFNSIRFGFRVLDGRKLIYLKKNHSNVSFVILILNK
jgi:hypothetical protein